MVSLDCLETVRLDFSKAVIGGCPQRVTPGHTDKTACETTANVSERGPTVACRCESGSVGWHWPRLAGSGAGDGNRKYHRGATNHLKSERYEVDRAARAIFV